MSHWKSVLLNQCTTGGLYMLHLHPTHTVTISVQRHRPVPRRATISTLSWWKNVFAVHHQNPRDHHFNTPARARPLPRWKSCHCVRWCKTAAGETHADAFQITSKPKSSWLGRVFHAAIFQRRRRKNKYNYYWVSTSPGGRGWSTGDSRAWPSAQKAVAGLGQRVAGVRGHPHSPGAPSTPGSRAQQAPAPAKHCRSTLGVSIVLKVPWN